MLLQTVNRYADDFYAKSGIPLALQQERLMDILCFVALKLHAEHLVDLECLTDGQIQHDLL